MSVRTGKTIQRLREPALRAALVTAGVVIATFLLLHLIPGDPAQMILGDRASNEAIQSLRETLGLNRPLWQQFVGFLSQILTEGNIGDSLVYKVPANHLVMSRLPVTLALVGLSTLLTIVLVGILSILSALNEGRIADHVIRFLSTIGAAMPVFWVAIILILLFSIHLRWFPVGGIGRAGFFNSLVLPSCTAAISTAPVLIRSLRTQLLEVINAGFVTMLKVSGVSRTRIVLRHILPNSVVPALILLGINIGGMLGGSIVLERVFSLPGIGALLFDAIAKRDIPLIQTIALFSALGVVIVSLITDLGVRFLDPRARQAS